MDLHNEFNHITSQAAVGSMTALSVVSDLLPNSSLSVRLPSSCRSTVSDTEFENVSSRRWEKSLGIEYIYIFDFIVIFS